MAKRRVVLMVNDGWGIAPPGPGNYIAAANTPFFDKVWNEYPHCENEASGNAVGLPEGQQGNSEVGHLHLGSGRVVWQMYELINRAIAEGSFFENEVLKEAMQKAKGGRLHLMGLVSDGGIHSHIGHLKALLEMAQRDEVQEVLIHFFADGRDVPEKSALDYVKQVEELCQVTGTGKIVTLVGRYYAMDRDLNWERTKAAFDLVVRGVGHEEETVEGAVMGAYERGAETDYYIEPTKIGDYRGVGIGDVGIFFNFRTDRPRQLMEALTFGKFDAFDRGDYQAMDVVSMTEYDRSFMNRYAFEEPRVEDCFSEVVSKAGLRQMKISESDKRPHVTFFFNAQRDEPFAGEEREEVPSPKVPAYDETPEMSADGVRDRAVEAIQSDMYSFVLVNFANADLVGHTAKKEAIVQAVETVDRGNEAVVKAALAHGYVVLLTSDHGNAEEKLYEDGSPKPSHTTNRVPFVLISSDEELKTVSLRNGGEIDVAPTMIELMGLEKPEGMRGESLVVRG